jgi:hypothetical protein
MKTNAEIKLLDQVKTSFNTAQLAVLLCQKMFQVDLPEEY